MLRIENLNVYYGGVHALVDINLEVSQGSVITFIGSNGAGKSSTLRSICGLVENVQGQILFDNQDLSKVEPYDRVRLGIAMVPEGRRILTNLTVMENLIMGAYSLKGNKNFQTDLKKVFELFPRLEERQNQRSITLSGGEQQMLAVGRALMSRPRLLLLDEPSLGLAPNLVKEMYQTFEQIHKEGLTILVVEQNAHLALQLAEYGYVLEVGHIVLQGPSAELAENEGVKKGVYRRLKGIYRCSISFWSDIIRKNLRFESVITSIQNLPILLPANPVRFALFCSSSSRLLKSSCGGSNPVWIISRL